MLAQSQVCSRMSGKTGAPGKQFIEERLGQPFLQTAPVPRRGEMSMYSVYVAPETMEQKVEVRCKTARAVNNIDIYIAIEAVADEDVLGGAGKILIPAGTKIIGRGY